MPQTSVSACRFWRRRGKGATVREKISRLRAGFTLGWFWRRQGDTALAGPCGGAAVGLDPVKMLAQQFELSKLRYAQRRKVAASQPETDKFFCVFVWNVGDQTLNFSHHLK